tara:strand:+ start:275 stop:1372 length:1098 start_codon:yes stop_codon:yes gene_type:complete
MTICIIGGGLTSLSLAQNLVNKKINVHIYDVDKNKDLSSNRTIGISQNNLQFFKKEILDIKKSNFWKIKKIKIFSEKLNNQEILNFTKKQNGLFFMVKNDELYKSLNISLLKSKFFKKKLIRNDNCYKKLLNENKYDLIINCDSKNFIAKKYFSKTIEKKYNNFAYTTTLLHKKLDNSTAVQVFTKYGPIAYLPISAKQTSVVYSLDFNKDKFNEKKIADLIKKHNPKYLINKMSKFENFELKSSNLRNYYQNNVGAFGDCLHKIHPLAGQGFNMTIRDIRAISLIIQDKINLGLQIDSLVFKEFEQKTKNANFVFSNGVDFLFEFFNFNKKIENTIFDKILKYFGDRETIKDILIKYADNGLKI